MSFLVKKSQLHKEYLRNSSGDSPLVRGLGGFFERRIFNENPNLTYSRFTCLRQDFPLQKTVINRISPAAMGHERMAAEDAFLGGAESE